MLASIESMRGRPHILIDVPLDLFDDEVLCTIATLCGALRVECDEFRAVKTCVALPRNWLCKPNLDLAPLLQKYKAAKTLSFVKNGRVRVGLPPRRQRILTLVSLSFVLMPALETVDTTLAGVQPLLFGGGIITRPLPPRTWAAIPYANVGARL